MSARSASASRAVSYGGSDDSGAEVLICETLSRMHPDLLALLEHARADHRAEVELGWERQRFFVGMNAALLVAGSAIGSWSPQAALPVLALGAVLSLVGALIAMRSHGRVRRTRDALDQVARRAGVEGPEVTGGQRALHGKARGEGYRVVALVVVALVVCGALDVGVAVRCALQVIRQTDAGHQ